MATQRGRPRKASGRRKRAGGDGTTPPVQSPLRETQRSDKHGCQNCGHPYERHIFGGACFFCECQRCVY